MKWTPQKTGIVMTVLAMIAVIGIGAVLQLYVFRNNPDSASIVKTIVIIIGAVLLLRYVREVDAANKATREEKQKEDNR